MKTVRCKLSPILKIFVLSLSPLLFAGCRPMIQTAPAGPEYAAYGIGVMPFDTENPLLKQNQVMLSGPLNFAMAHSICQSLVALDNDLGRDDRAITMFINSTGGDLLAYVTIANMVRTLQSPVDMVNIGMCGSAAAMLFQEATGRRLAYESAVFMLHEPTGRPRDLLELLTSRQEELFRRTANLPEDWLPMRGREFLLTAEQALEYDFIDEIILMNRRQEDIK